MLLAMLTDPINWTGCMQLTPPPMLLLLLLLLLLLTLMTRFPMLFHAVVGKDEREANSPSWFNVTGALPDLPDHVITMYCSLKMERTKLISGVASIYLQLPRFWFCEPQIGIGSALL
jgi:protein-S-isoprenylcysteine O-methyltransferase Ste14